MIIFLGGLGELTDFGTGLYVAVLNLLATPPTAVSDFDRVVLRSD